MSPVVTLTLTLEAEGAEPLHVRSVADAEMPLDLLWPVFLEAIGNAVADERRARLLASLEAEGRNVQHPDLLVSGHSVRVADLCLRPAEKA